MSANTPPKPHREGMVFTNEETGIKYQFSDGAWRAVSSSASEEVVEAIDNLDLQKVLDTGNVADKGATFGGKVIVEPGTEGNEAVTYSQLTTQLTTPTLDDVLQEGNVADTEAAFKKPVTIDMPHSVLKPLVIKGTSFSGTVNSDVLFVQNTSTPTNRTSVRYRGIVDDSYDIANKKYVDDAVAAVNGPASHKWTYRAGKDKLDLLPGEFTGPNDHKYGQGKHFSYYFHPESLTSRMGFYKDYDMYFPMNALWGAFHFWDTNYDPQWKLKQYVPVRNIHMFNDDNYLEIYTHTDYPQGGEVISRFDDGRDYHFSIGGMI